MHENTFIGARCKDTNRAKVDSYPVIERYNIVFAFLGDLPEDERPSLYEIEEYEAEGWRANQTTIIDIDYNYERSIGNGLIQLTTSSFIPLMDSQERGTITKLIRLKLPK